MTMSHSRETRGERTSSREACRAGGERSNEAKKGLCLSSGQRDTNTQRVRERERERESRPERRRGKTTFVERGRRMDAHERRGESGQTTDKRYTVRP